MEIERKFLIENTENVCSDLNIYPQKRFVQGYINIDPAIRVRNEGGALKLCVKSGGGMAREEFELELTYKQFNGLWEKITGNAIEKDRYFIPLETGHTAELDIYKGSLAGLATVEVEFGSKEEAEAFSPPVWFGKELTYDARYQNANLAAYGLPER